MFRCAVGNKNMFCGTTIKQGGDKFYLGTKDHCHPGTPGQHIVTNVVRQMKVKAADKLFEPAGHIVDDVLVHNIDGVPVPSLPQQRSLVRTDNRLRQKDRPKEPTDIDFDLRYEAIPEGKYKIKQNKKFTFDFPLFHIGFVLHGMLIFEVI